MIDCNKIIFTTICYLTEELDLVEQSLKNCIPEKFRNQKVILTKMQSQFNDRLIYLKLDFNKKLEIDKCLQYLSNNFEVKSKGYWINNLENYINMASKSIYLRLNKFRPLNNIIDLGEGSDVIKVEIKYSAYTSEQNSLENISNMLIKKGFVIWLMI